MVFVGRDVCQFEVEKENDRDLAVDGGVRLDVGVAEHTFNIACVHFNNEIADANEVEAHHA
jgi:hypothetical protein